MYLEALEDVRERENMQPTEAPGFVEMEVGTLKAFPATPR